jgi:ABC-2 type transport system permease protein
VFNPVSALPGAVEPIARILPTTFAFSAMREVLDGAPIPWDDITAGVAGGLVCTAMAYAFVVKMLSTFRARGFVTRFS